jgi:hypothetical protein
LTGSPTGGAFTLGTTSTAVTGGSFSLTGSTLTYSGGTSAGTATADVTYTVTGFTPVTETYSVTVTGGERLPYRLAQPLRVVLLLEEVLNRHFNRFSYGWAFTLGATSTTATGGSFSLTGSTFDLFGWNLCWNCNC